MRASLSCSRGLVGEGIFDYLGDEGRVRARSLYVVARPARLRFDVLSPVGGVLSTLTSNGEDFAFADRRERVFVVGPANQCNVNRALGVPLPPEALGELLGGQAPILQHEAGAAELGWDSGSYLLEIAGEHEATQRVRLVPRDEDWERPWQEQRLRVVEVSVAQRGLTLYEVLLKEHGPASTAAPRVDPDGLEPDVPPSGPRCDAEVPRRLRFEVPGEGRSILFEQVDVHHNPPLTPELFTQQPPPGMRIQRSPCGGPTLEPELSLLR